MDKRSTSIKFPTRRLRRARHTRSDRVDLFLGVAEWVWVKGGEVSKVLLEANLEDQPNPCGLLIPGLVPYLTAPLI
jgi:hypothetical protein